MIDAVFHALSDPARRSLLERLDDRSGQTLKELCTGQAMARQSVRKHLGVLEAAGLVVSQRRGRERLHARTTVSLGELTGHWIARLDDSAPSPGAVVVYVRTTPGRAIEALVSPALSSRWWLAAGGLDPHGGAGAGWVLAPARLEGPGAARGAPGAMPNPASPLAHWVTLTAQLRGASHDPESAGPAGSRCEVRVAVETLGWVVRLVVHDEVASLGAPAIRGPDWAAAMSSLKSLLETGEALGP